MSAFVVACTDILCYSFKCTYESRKETKGGWTFTLRCNLVELNFYSYNEGLRRKYIELCPIGYKLG